MAENVSASVPVQEVSEIAALAKRAGLKLTEAELTNTVEPYRRLQANLRVLRACLEAEEEPANTFAARSLDGGVAGGSRIAPTLASNLNPASGEQGETRGSAADNAGAPPAGSDDLCYLPISALAREIAARRLSPVELVEALLRRIAAVDGRLHTFLTLTADRARAEAKAAELAIARGDYRGPLHGVPVAVKDIFATAGVRTTAQSELLTDWIPDEESTCTRRLAEAGTAFLGKLTLHEFAFSPPDLEGYFPPARNPWNLEYQPSGSSSGSAAGLAAGLFPGSLGTDTGGSIRGPASWCGIVGLKPTYGLCSRYGVLPGSWSLDHIGPMARSVEDCAILLQAIAGYDPADPASASVPIPDYRAALRRDLRGLRVGAPLPFVEAIAGLDQETLAAYRAALGEIERLGAQVVVVDLPALEHIEAVNSVVHLAETFAAHEESLQTRPHLSGPGFRARTYLGALLSAADYLAAQRVRTRINRQMGQLMSRVDLLALPTSPTPAQTFAQAAATPAWMYITPTRPLFNTTGQPAISVPCGFSPHGLPIGLQLAGRPFEDATVLAAAHAYQQATDWHQRRPPLG